MNVHFTHVVNFIFTEERSAYIFISDTWSGVSSGVRLPAHWSIDTFIINTLMSGHSRSNSPHRIKLPGLRGPAGSTKFGKISTELFSIREGYTTPIYDNGTQMITMSKSTMYCVLWWYVMCTTHMTFDGHPNRPIHSFDCHQVIKHCASFHHHQMHLSPSLTEVFRI